MPERSSSSVRVVFADREKILEGLRAAVADLAARNPEVEEIILFGSLARGDLTPRSDADLLVVLQRAEDDPRDRIPRYMPRRCPVPVDVFPFTRAEVDERVRAGDHFFARILREGIRIYPSARQPDSPSSPASGGSPRSC